MLSVNVKVAERAPEAEGLNVTLTEHEDPAASGELQVDSVKSAAAAPESVMAVIESPAEPLFVNVTVFVLLLPTTTDPNARLVGERLTLGAVPLPVRLTA